MKKLLANITNQTKQFSRGDTIIEVLIAIAIAAFAIGTSYAIANKSLQRAITARERNEALNIVQSQISALKFREKTDVTSFNTGFAVPDSFSGAYPASAFHFCLDDQSTGTVDVAHPWARFDNNVSDTSAANLSVGSTGYNPKCKIAGSGTDFFIDIAAQVTPTSQSSSTRTVYKTTVRWAEIGTGVIQQSTVYYRF